MEMTPEWFMTTKHYRKRVPPPEDHSDEERDNKAWVLRDAAGQLEAYKKQFGIEENDGAGPAVDLKLVTLHVPESRNTDEKPVTLQPKVESRNTKSRADYMRQYRRRPKKCPHCGKEL